MGRFRDEAGHIWDVGPDGKPVLVQQAGQQSQMPANPRFPYEGPKAAADAQTASADATLKGAQAPYARQLAKAEADKATADARRASADAKAAEDKASGQLPDTPAFHARVQQLLDGRSILTAREKGQPLGQQLMDAANLQDPTFDENVSHARYLARQQFTGMGKGSLNIQAAERLASHVNDLYDASRSLPGPDLGFSPLSNAAGYVAQRFDQRDLARYNVTLPLIAGELQKLTKNGASTEAESAHIMANLAPSQPRDVREAAIQEIVKLGRAQVQPLHNAWESAWQGTTPPPMPNDIDAPTNTIFDNIENGGPALKRDHNGAFILPGSPVGGGNGSNPGGGSPPPNPTLAPAGAGEKALPIPPAMQAAHQRYLQQHWGHIDPTGYAAFRAGLDKQYGFNTGLGADMAYAGKVNQYAARGGKPQQQIIGPVSAQMNARDKFNATMFNNRVGAGVLGAGSLGGGMDEVVAGLKAPFTGRSYQEELDRANAIRKTVSDEYPISNAVGNVAGTLALAGATGGTSLGATMAENPLLTGTAYGLLTGGLENNDHRLSGAATGGAFGYGGGLLGKYVAAPIAQRLMATDAGQAVSRGARSLYNGTLGKVPGLPGVASEAAIPSFSPAEQATVGVKPDLTQIATNLRDAGRLNLPYSLADADPKLRMLGGAVARRSVNARDLAERTFDPRATGQAERAYDAIDTHLAPITDIGERGGQWRQAAQTESSPFYAAARNRAAPVDDRIGAFLETPVGKRAVADAQDMAANEGRDPNAMGFDLNDQGEVVIRDLPSWETLDYVKRGIDQQLAPYRNPITDHLDLEGNPAAQGIENFRRRFLAVGDELNPDWAAARRAYAGQIQNRDALQMGTKGPGPAIKPRDLPRITGDFNPTQMGEYQRGFATTMGDHVNDTRLAANPYDRVYGTPNQQAKVGAVFPEGAPNFGRAYDLERDMSKTRGEVLGGSPTAGRFQADEQLGGEQGLGSQVIDQGVSAFTGGGIHPMRLIRGATEALRNSHTLGRGVQRADAIAPTLFDITNPSGIADGVEQLAAKNAAMNARKDWFARRYGLFGALSTPSLMPPS
jgi:hypothetical protein